VKERFLRAYMTEGEPIGDPATLLRLATEAGLDGAEVQQALSTDAHARAVRADERQATELGISGVPFFVLGGRLAVSGAQPAELLLRALHQAWDTLEARPAPFADGDTCGPGGC
jgi:predicted DsbA family dithiol-disulfide isomerase